LFCNATTTALSGCIKCDDEPGWESNPKSFLQRFLNGIASHATVQKDDITASEFPRTQQHALVKSHRIKKN
jgi:uncharacterized protein YehS (DUF1456 family)